MELYTSYFENAKHILKVVPNAVLVSIAGKTPDWFNGKKFKKLMPHYYWWKEWHDTFEGCLDSEESKVWYFDKYNSTILSQLNPVKIAEELEDIANGHPIFMLCYETPEKFCHRHIVSNWLNNVGILCKEWIDEQ